MAVTLITIIGTNLYSKTTYAFDEQSNKPVKYFPDALAQYLLGQSETIEKAFVIATEKAQNSNWSGKDQNGEPNLEECFRQLGIAAEVISVPNGANQDEAWQIFDAVAEKIPEDAEVIFDITHGFRNIPMLLLAVMRYLHEAQRVSIKRVYYGAYEAVERPRKQASQSPVAAEVEEPKTPVYELTSFVTLLDWANAVEVFNRTGNSTLLASQLRNIQDGLYRANNAPDQLKPKALPTRLKNVADRLEKLSTALDLVRPLEVMELAHELMNQLNAAKTEFPTWAKPFNILLEKVRETFSSLALSASKSEDADSEEVIRKKRLLIQWYQEHGRYLAAALLAREWVVSLVIHQNGLPTKILDTETRRATEELLNGLQRFRRDKSTLQTNMRIEQDVLKVWVQIPDVRNDLAHCGMRKSPKPAENLSEIIQNIVQLIQHIKLNEETA
ncbi:TIGR02221 family CRISPR-associated protein [bacterium]|nr:TIGR02221 family CRISPR-associated protein [bacterium]